MKVPFLAAMVGFVSLRSYASLSVIVMGSSRTVVPVCCVSLSDVQNLVVEPYAPDKHGVNTQTEDIPTLIDLSMANVSFQVVNPEEDRRFIVTDRHETQRGPAISTAPYEELLNQGDRPVPRLRAMIAAGDSQSYRALATISKMGPSAGGAVEAVAKAAFGDLGDDLLLRVLGINALGKMGPGSSAYLRQLERVVAHNDINEPLVQAERNGRLALRAAALDAIVEISPPSLGDQPYWVNSLSSTRLGMRAIAARKLRALSPKDPEVISALHEALVSTGTSISHDFMVIGDALVSIASAHREAQQRFFKLCGWSGGPKGVFSLAWRVRPAPNELSVSELIALIDHPEATAQNDRIRAIADLGNVGPSDPRVVPALIRLLTDHFGMGNFAAAAIARIGPAAKDAIPALITTPGRGDYVAALKAMGPIAIPALREGIASGPVAQRRQAAEAMGGMNSAVVPALVTAIEHDEDKEVRWFAIRSLGELGTQAAAGFPEMIKVLNDPDRSLRAGGARALGALGALAVDGVPALVKVLNDPDDWVREEAMISLGKIGSASKAGEKAVMPTLIREIGKGNIRAVEALDSMSADAQKEALPDLKQFVATSRNGMAWKAGIIINCLEHSGNCGGGSSLRPKISPASAPAPAPLVNQNATFGTASQGDEQKRNVAKEGHVGSEKIVWIKIPSGSFMMGSDTEPNSTRPAHRVAIKSFEMAKTLVTVMQYRACVDAGACSPPSMFGSHCGRELVFADNQPIVCVTAKQADTFSRWVGGRLPSEAEWEYAARSAGKDWLYPWGNEVATCDRAVIRENDRDGCGRGTSWPVCSRPDGNTEQGLCDMAGNVPEIVADVFHSNYVGAPADGSAWSVEVFPPGSRVTRGGSYSQTFWDARAISRRVHVDGALGSPYVDGFRPVREAR